MDAGIDEIGDGGGRVGLYAVLGLERRCSAAELRHAYKKLAMRWHPDRFFSAGKSETVEEAKAKFQSIQEAYEVLSDKNKRFMYDVGILDSGDDEDLDCDFMREMIEMMNETWTGNVTSEELQSLFMEMINGNTTSGGAVAPQAQERKSGGVVMCSPKAKIMGVAKNATGPP